jgi:hypothetical protein
MAKQSLVVALLTIAVLATATGPSAAAKPDGRCDWLGDPELIARCRAGGGSLGHGGIPPEWIEYGKGWKIEKVTICPDGTPRVLRLLYWLDGELWNSEVRDIDFGGRFGPGDLVPYAPRRSDGTPAVFGSDGLVPDVAYCVQPIGDIDLTKEILERAPAGEPVTNPSVDGLTGLDTWLWYQGGTEIPAFTLTFTDPGSGITLEIEAWASIDTFTWDMGDGTVLTTSLPGSADDLPASAAGIHRYEQKGDYTITFTVDWNGTYRWRQVPGGSWSAPIPFPGNPATISTSLPYHVSEVRSVLQP